MPVKDQRLDILVSERGLAESREKAQRLVRAGQVKADGQIAGKPAQRFPPSAVIEVISQPRYVSRGGEKLERAFVFFGLSVEGCLCLDVGSSTGGFTDCLLQHGAARVYAVDVGKGLLHWRLRQDPRVVAMEGINARRLDSTMFPERARFATIDVAFISLTRILPAVTRVLEAGGQIVSLIKPQFEAGPKQVGKGGVVRRPEIRAQVVEDVRSFGTKELGLVWRGVCESPIRGPAGNIEFLALWQWKP